MLLPHATFRGLELNLDLRNSFSKRPHLLLIGSAASADEHDIGDHVSNGLELRLQQARDRRSRALNLLAVLREWLAISLRLGHALDDRIQPLHMRDRLFDGLELGETGAINLGSQWMSEVGCRKRRSNDKNKPIHLPYARADQTRLSGIRHPTSDIPFQTMVLGLSNWSSSLRLRSFFSNTTS